MRAIRDLSGEYTGVLTPKENKSSGLVPNGKTSKIDQPVSGDDKRIIKQFVKNTRPKASPVKRSPTLEFDTGKDLSDIWRNVVYSTGKPLTQKTTPKKKEPKGLTAEQ